MKWIDYSLTGYWDFTQMLSPLRIWVNNMSLT